MDSDAAHKPMSDGIRVLNNYLAECKHDLTKKFVCHVVISSEAADLTSMASSIMYGLYSSVCNSDDYNKFIPVINIPRSDFVLRHGTAYLFDAVGIDVAALLFIDEIDLGRLYSGNRLKLVLIDHNVVAGGQALYAGVVEAIVDHHDDAGLYAHARPRTIEPVGSTATLVADAILRHRPELIDAGTATLLLGTILLDTVNLSRDAKRVTPKDEAIANRLRSIAGSDPNALFEKLRAERFNLSSLRTDDLLRKDYREWQTATARYGMSTVLTPLSSWIAKDPDVLAGLDVYLRSRALDCLVAMLAYTDAADGKFHRELAILVPDQALRTCLVTLLQSTALGLRQFDPPDLPPSERLVFFHETDPSVSRNRLQPVLHRFFAGDGDEDPDVPPS